MLIEEGLADFLHMVVSQFEELDSRSCRLLYICYNKFERARHNTQSTCASIQSELWVKEATVETYFNSKNAYLILDSLN